MSVPVMTRRLFGWGRVCGGVKDNSGIPDRNNITPMTSEEPKSEPTSHLRKEVLICMATCNDLVSVTAAGNARRLVGRFASQLILESYTH